MDLKTKKSRLILMPDGHKMFLSVLDSDGNTFQPTPEIIQVDIDNGVVQELDEDYLVYIDNNDLTSAIPFEQYSSLRKQEYKEIKEQLDSLWHDVDSGIFGDNAKNSNWYKGIKAIKEKYPKQ
jgi:hypothetical protein